MLRQIVPELVSSRHLHEPDDFVENVPRQHALDPLLAAFATHVLAEEHGAVQTLFKVVRMQARVSIGLVCGQVLDEETRTSGSLRRLIALVLSRRTSSPNATSVSESRSLRRGFGFCGSGCANVGSPAWENGASASSLADISNLERDFKIIVTKDTILERDFEIIVIKRY